MGRARLGMTLAPLVLLDSRPPPFLSPPIRCLVIIRPSAFPSWLSPETAPILLRVAFHELVPHDREISFAVDSVTLALRLGVISRTVAVQCHIPLTPIVTGVCCLLASILRLVAPHVGVLVPLPGCLADKKTPPFRILQ